MMGPVSRTWWRRLKRPGHRVVEEVQAGDGSINPRKEDAEGSCRLQLAEQAGLTGELKISFVQRRR
jgi:hypothetical protein